MLISVSDLAVVWGVTPSGVLHVGAHEGEEAEAYAAQGWKPVWWIEMLPDKCAYLRARFGDDPSNQVLQGACWDENGVDLSVFRANNGQSSSLLAPTEHLQDYPDIAFETTTSIRTTRLDSLLPSTATFDFVNLDLQGAELRALRGLGHHLRQVKWAYVEVNTRPLYEQCCLIDELDRFMHSTGFSRVVTRMAGSASGWGDALYANPDRIGKMPLRTTVAFRIKQTKWTTWQSIRKPLGAVKRAVKKALSGSSRGPRRIG